MQKQGTRPFNFSEEFKKRRSAQADSVRDSWWRALLRFLSGKIERQAACYYVLASAAEGAQSRAPFQMKSLVIEKTAVYGRLRSNVRERLRGAFEQRTQQAKYDLLLRALESVPLKWREMVFVQSVDVALADGVLPQHKQERLDLVAGKLMPSRQIDAQAHARLLRAKNERLDGPTSPSAMLGSEFTGLLGSMTPLQAVEHLSYCAIKSEGGRGNLTPEQLYPAMKLALGALDRTDAEFAKTQPQIWAQADPKNERAIKDACQSVPAARRLTAYAQVVDAAFAVVERHGAIAETLTMIAGEMGLSEGDRAQVISTLRLKYGL